MRECSIDGCDNPVKARGWCRTHYMRWYHTGDPELLRGGRWDGYQRPICEVEGCGNVSHAKKLCASHFFRMRRHGDPLVGRRPNVVGTPDERFFALREIDEDGCWLNVAAPMKVGYGQFYPGDTDRLAYWHRWAYERFIGPIPNGLHLDHLCHNRDLDCEGGSCKHRLCGNPSHLEAVPLAVNIARGNERKKMKQERDLREFAFGIRV